MTTQTSPRTKSSPAVYLRAEADGTYSALSSTDYVTVYDLSLSPLSCTCPGFTYRGACKHAAALVERFGGLQCQHCGHQGADVAAFTHRTTGDTFTLCTDTAACLSRQGWGRGTEVA